MLRKFIGIVMMGTLGLGCAKGDGILPDVPVNFSAPVTDPRLNRLSTAGGAITLTGHGIAGLIIYRRPDNAYVAYDRCSTVNPEKKTPINLDDPTLTATDPVSGAKYSLYDGSPVKAPAKTFLKKYMVTLAGNTLKVTN